MSKCLCGTPCAVPYDSQYEPACSEKCNIKGKELIAEEGELYIDLSVERFCPLFATCVNNYVVPSCMKIRFNNCRCMKFNLFSPLFNECFDQKPICSVLLTNNFNGTIDLKISFITSASSIPIGACEGLIDDCKIVKSSLLVKYASAYSLILTLASNIFDCRFDSRCITLVAVYKNFNGSIDLKLLFC